MRTRDVARATFALLLALSLAGACARNGAETDTPEPPAQASDRTSASASGEEGVVLSAVEQERLGLATAKLEPAERQTRTEGIATIVAVAALSELDADLSAARAASAASAAALARAEALYADQVSVSLAAVESARRQKATDDAQVERLERSLALDWGPRIAGSPFPDDAKRRDWLDRVAAGRAVLARAQFPLGASLPRAPSLRFERLTSFRAPAGVPTVEAIWSAPEDPALPGPAYFALLSGRDLPQTAERLRVTADASERRRGVSIPESAIVLSGGSAWCFIATRAEGGARRFVRRPVPLALGADGPAAEGERSSAATGYFAATGFAPGESVVVRGAGLLLSREVAATASDEGDEDP